MRYRRAATVTVSVLGLTACGPERPAAPGSYAASPQAAQAPAGRHDLPDDAYRVSWGEVSLPAVLAPGARVDVPVTFTNTGTVTWPGSTRGELHVVRLTHRWLLSDEGVFQDYGDRRRELGGPVAPQQTVTVADTLTAPSTPGAYVVQFELIHEGVTHFSKKGAAKKLVVVAVGG